MRKIIFLLFAIVTTINLHSQNLDIAYPHVVSMSPNAAELAKYADYPVSYYNGIPNTSIPLYEVNVDGFKLPITLDYHASGIRVDQEATWVGLGWALNVGSRISRTINSAEDFHMVWDNNFPNLIQGYCDAPDQDEALFTHYGQAGDTSCNYWPLGCSSYELFYDPEPDIFYYSLPNMNGKFLLDKSRGPVLFDKSHNLKIEFFRNVPGLGLGSVAFKITDSEGIQYIYNKWESTQTYSATGWINKNIHAENTIYDTNENSFLNWYNIREDDAPGSGSGSSDPRVTSWCLTKIVTKHGREINFNYDSEIQYLPSQESCENYHFGSEHSTYYYKSKSVHNVQRLTSIQGDFGQIDFNSSVRSDINGTSKKLDNISIYNSTNPTSNSLVKSFRFNYNYFNEDYSGNSQYVHVFKRLKLNSLTEYSVNNPVNGGYLFDYYEGNFPPKNSKNVDYWGFQNGKTYGQDYYIGISIPAGAVHLGVKKDMNFEKAIIGTLKKITYPTKGEAEFKYESNTILGGYFASHTIDSTSGINSIVNLPVYNYHSMFPDGFEELPPSQNVHTFTVEPQSQTTIKIVSSVVSSSGVKDNAYFYGSTGNPLGRLKRITPNAHTYYTYYCPYVYEYSYPNATEGQGSEIVFPDREYVLGPGTYEFIAYTPPKDVLVSWQLFLHTPSLLGEAISNVGGIRIKEIKTDAKTRKFNYPLGTMLVEPILYYYGRRSGIPPWFVGLCDVQVSECKAPLSTFNNANFVGYDWVEEYLTDENGDISKTKYTFHNEPETEIFNDDFADSPRRIIYRNGLIQSVEKFKNATLVEKDEYTYTSTFGNYIKAFKDKGMSHVGNNGGAVGASPFNARIILQYWYRVEWPLKTNTINTLKTDDGESIVSETTYSYNSKDLLQSTSYNLLNYQKSEEVKYPFDFTDPVSLSMVSKNMIGVPVQTKTFTDGENTSTQQTIYKDWGGGLIAPEIVKTSKGLASPENRLKYNAYDQKGNLLEVQQESGMKISYIWGYNKTQPVAKIENMAYSAIPPTLITNIQSASNSPNNEANVIAALTALRTDIALSNAMVTTYTYKLLVGVSTITDPKGDKVTYEYDEFNRLKAVYDILGNKLSENDYHYKN